MTARWRRTPTLLYLGLAVGLAEGCDLTEPSAAPADVNWASVTVGDAHACALDVDGRAACWGANDRGQSAVSTGDWLAVPTWVDTDLRFSSIDAGGRHTCAIDTEDALWCWGANDLGQLGDLTFADHGAPGRVELGGPVREVSAGAFHSCAVRADRVAMCWGDDHVGQSGSGLAAQDPLPPTPVEGGLRFHSVSAGQAHSCGVTTSGNAYCWGSNVVGALGTGTQVSSPRPNVVSGFVTGRSVRAGPAHTCALDNDGSGWCWGDNTFGQTSPSQVRVVGSAERLKAEGVVSIDVGEGWTCSVDVSGSVTCKGLDWDTLPEARPTRPGGWTPAAIAGGAVVALALGGRNACAVTAAGGIVCWGAQLGV
jgi:alpha-tubulin suppressor-like RCC1 family protein